MTSWIKTSCLSLALTVLMLSGCKQGEGEICQVKADCVDGLVCNSRLGVCETAPISTDPTPDAAPMSTPDAAPAPDAALPDAALPDAALMN